MRFFTFRNADFTHTKYYVFGSSPAHKFRGGQLKKKIIHESDNYLKQFTKGVSFFLWERKTTGKKGYFCVTKC